MGFFVSGRQRARLLITRRMLNDTLNEVKAVGIDIAGSDAVCQRLDQFEELMGSAEGCLDDILAIEEGDEPGPTAG